MDKEMKKLMHYVTYLQDHFETAKRANKDEEFVRLKEGTEEWCKDMMYHVHDRAMPNDHVYATTRALTEELFHLLQEVKECAISCERDMDDILNEAEYALVERMIYYCELKQWVIDSPDSFTCIEEAMREFGEFDSAFDLFRTAYAVEVRGILSRMVEFISKIEDDIDWED